MVIPTTARERDTIRSGAVDRSLDGQLGQGVVAIGEWPATFPQCQAIGIN
jgi:hypothetical protein